MIFHRRDLNAITMAAAPRWSRLSHLITLFPYVLLSGDCQLQLAGVALMLFHFAVFSVLLDLFFCLWVYKLYNCSLMNKLPWLSCPLFSTADILFFKESFLSPNKSVSNPGKTIFWSDRLGRPSHGLAIAVNNTWSSDSINLGRIGSPPASVNWVLDEI